MINPTIVAENTYIVPDGLDRSEFTSFSGLKQWFVSLVESIKPDLIVGIARGAIRVLQIEDIDKIINDIPIISNHALSFFSDEDIRQKKVLLFDDSVIYGSTLSSVRKHLINRGAIVFCASYVIDREEFFGEINPDNFQYLKPSPFSEINIEFEKKMWSEEIKKHHYLLVNTLLQTPRDYNLDFPTIKLRLPNFDNYDIPFIIHQLKKSSMIRDIIDVSTPLSIVGGIYRYTGIFSSFNKTIFAVDGLDWLPNSKIRLTFIPELNEIRIKPMPLLVMNESIGFQDVKFHDTKLNDFWQTLSSPNLNDEFFHQGVFRLLTFVTSLVLGKFVSNQFNSLLETEFPVNITEIDDEDIRVSLGNNNSDKLAAMWTTLFDKELRLDLNIQKDLSESANEVDDNIIRKFRDEWKSNLNLKPYPRQKPYEILGKVFLTLHKVTDSKERREENSDASRLDIGLTFGGIKHILENECSITLGDDLLSATLDVCVDYGQAVPKVIKQGSVWLRAFYSGEGYSAQDLIQLRDSLYKGYSEFLTKKNSEQLNEYDFHKLSSSLKEILPWLPISLTFNTFGRFATIERTSGKNDDIINWLINSHTPPFTINKERKSTLAINNNYKSNINSVWSDENNLAFFDGFEYLATAFKVSKDDNIKLLLSTCRNHLNTFEAIATEAHSWVYDGKTSGFDAILSNAEKSFFDSSHRDSIKLSLYWCVIFLSEAQKKYILFHKNFALTSKHLEEALSKQGSSAKRYWDFRIKKLLDPSEDDEISILLKFLLPILKQMEALTAYIIKILIEFDIFSEGEFEKIFQDRYQSLRYKEFTWLEIGKPALDFAVKYNIGLKDREISQSILKTALNPSFDPSAGKFEQFALIIKNCVKCFYEIKDVMRSYVPAHIPIEGGYNYAPVGKVRVRTDGSTVKNVKNIFILTMDIIGSTNNELANEMKDFVINKLRDFKTIHYEKTGNDEFLICSFDPMMLWDIARIIMVKGENLKRAENEFGGVRKALSKGNISIVTDAHNTTMIRDSVIPNTLPKSFYLLEAYKSKNSLQEMGKQMHNKFIVIEEETAKELSVTFELKCEDREQISLKAKHFNGNFLYFEM